MVEVQQTKTFDVVLKTKADISDEFWNEIYSDNSHSVEVTSDFGELV